MKSMELLNVAKKGSVTLQIVAAVVKKSNLKQINVFEVINKHFQNPSKHLSWSFSSKIVNSFHQLTIFAKCFIFLVDRVPNITLEHFAFNSSPTNLSFKTTSVWQWPDILHSALKKQKQANINKYYW